MEGALVRPPVIIPRDEWGAQPTTAGKQMQYPLHVLIEDYMPMVIPPGEEDFRGVDECFTKEDCMQKVRDLQQEAFNLGQEDIKYNFLIGGDGNIYEGRGWDRNTNDMYPEMLSLSLGYIGNFWKVNVQLPQKIAEAKEHLLKYALQQNILKEKYINWTLKEKRFTKPGEPEEKPTDECSSEDFDKLREAINALETDEEVRKNGPCAEIIYVDTEPEEEPKDL